MFCAYYTKKSTTKVNAFLLSSPSISTDSSEDENNIFKAPPEIRDATFNKLLLNDIEKKEEEIKKQKRKKKKFINRFKRFIWHKFLKYYL